MGVQRLASSIIIIGFVIFWVGNLTSPPGVYSEVEEEEMVGAIKAVGGVRPSSARRLPLE